MWAVEGVVIGSLTNSGGQVALPIRRREGGTGKSRIIHAIKDMFRIRDGLHTVLLVCIFSLAERSFRSKRPYT